MNCTSSKTLSNEQVLIISALENSFTENVKQLLNTPQFSHLQISFDIHIEDKSGGSNPALSSNADFKIQSSLAMDSHLQELIAKQCYGDLLNQYQITFKVSYSQKKKKNEENADKSESQLELLPSKPKWRLDQVIMPENTRIEILDALKNILCKELIYEKWGFAEVDRVPRSILNFYGEPGTGKTMCAHAVAHQIGKDILCLNYSEIESKYVGEAPKNLKRAFDVAKEKDCVVFFDEADSFLGKRIQNVTQGAEQALNSLRSQMLILLEEFDGVVIFATNLVTNFDQAFNSRILKHVKFELPDQKARAAIIKGMIPSKLPLVSPFSEEQYMEASALIDGLAGREIKNAVLDMILRKADPKNEDVIFTFDDLCESLKKRKEMQEQLKAEEDKRIKNRIMNKLKEKSMEIQAEQDAEEISDDYLLGVGFIKESDNVFVKNDVQRPCKIIRKNEGKYCFPMMQDVHSDQVIERSIMVNKVDLREAIKELYAEFPQDLEKFNF